MNIHHLVLMMGLMLTCVGGYFSIVGLATIFAGAFWSVVIMAATLELSKVVAASWIYRSWSIAPVLIRTYMVLSIIVLVFITSLGIFGYLSKAHLEHSISTGGTNELQIENLQRQIYRKESQMQLMPVQKQLDRASIRLQSLPEHKRAPIKNQGRKYRACPHQKPIHKIRVVG
jgi:hypothetical protein